MSFSDSGMPVHDAGLGEDERDPTRETLASLVASAGDDPIAGDEVPRRPDVASGQPDASDTSTRLTRLIATLDGVAARLQETQNASAIPEITGAALQAQGIESHIALLDDPLATSAVSAPPATSPPANSQRLRTVYASVLRSRQTIIEQLIGRSVAQIAIPLEQVEVFARAVETRQACYVPDTFAATRQALPWLAEPLTRRLIQLAGASTAVVAPLLSRGRVLGVMSMWSNDLRPGDVTILGAFARQAGIVLDNLHEYHAMEQERAQEQERLEAQVRRAETLARVALALETERELPVLLARIALGARDLTNADGAGFLLRAAPHTPFEVVGAVGVSRATVRALQQPYVPDLALLRPLLREGTPLLLPDAPSVAEPHEARLLKGARVRAFAAVPLLASAGWISGALVVGHRAVGTFTQEHADLLAALAAQASAAIERTRALEEAQRHASELEAMFASVTAGVAIYDMQGQMVRINAAGERITSQSILPGEAPSDRARRFVMRLPTGEPVPLDSMPSLRATRGESFQGVEFLVNGEDGPDTLIRVSGAPLRGADGQVRGGVLEYRNVTSVRQLRRRTRIALDALLRIAAALVTPEETAAALREDNTLFSEGVVLASASRLDTILGYLGQLAREMLGARRVLISLIDMRTRIETPGAAAGLTELEMTRWIEDFAPREDNPLFGDVNPEAAARLRTGETVLVDFHQPPYTGETYPFDIPLALVVPMRVEGELVGMMMLDKPPRETEPADRPYSDDEIALAQGVARLAALAVQRERLEGVASEVEDLRVTNALKEEFLSIASHELKTPLTVLRARTQATQRRLLRLGQTEAAEQFAAVQISLDRMQALVSELLDTTRIEAGKLDLHPRPLDLGQVVRAAVEEAADASGRTITLEGAEAPDLWTDGDPDRLPQVLTNLLDNARKYGPEGQPIVVRIWRAPAGTAGVSEDDVQAGVSIPPTDSDAEFSAELSAASEARVRQYDEVVVTVADQGVGIPPDELRHVFERFYRARTSSSRQYGGLGLGLHIAANIVEWHHGRIWGRSSGPGGGSIFGVALPALDTPAAGAPTAPTTGNGANDDVRDETSDV